MFPNGLAIIGVYLQSCVNAVRLPKNIYIIYLFMLDNLFNLLYYYIYKRFDELQSLVNKEVNQMSEVTTNNNVADKAILLKDIRKRFNFVSGKIFGNIQAVAVHPTTGRAMSVTIQSVDIESCQVTFSPIDGPHKGRAITTDGQLLFDGISKKSGLPAGRSWLKNFIDKLSLGVQADSQEMFAKEIE